LRPKEVSSPPFETARGFDSKSGDRRVDGYSQWMTDRVQPRFSPYSLKSVRIDVIGKDEEAVLQASGFLVSHYGGIWLVTNDHVVSGFNFESRLVRERDKVWLGWANEGVSRPSKLRVHLPTPDEQAPDALFAELNPEHMDIELYDSSFNELWTSVKDEYPHGRLLADVVGIPVPKVEQDRLDLSAHCYTWNGEHPYFSVTDRVFVVGYPASVGKHVPTTPIWTGGSVASEPEIGLGMRFFIDSRTRPGQSGSPVIAHRQSRFLDAAAGLGEELPEKAILLGIYSGRTDENSDIGSVWKTSVLARIFNR